MRSGVGKGSVKARESLVEVATRPSGCAAATGEKPSAIGFDVHSGNALEIDCHRALFNSALEIDARDRDDWMKMVERPEDRWKTCFHMLGEVTEWPEARATNLVRMSVR